ncbi:MAG TPA: POTRA domain-containing protein, partial [Kofleriaceae bacterium]|nr:POTRA domain-containing protein [Kofleriaceae bacterium]
MTRALLLLCLIAGTARAQAPAPAAEPPPDDGQPIELTPTKVDAASCLPLDLTPGALLQAPQQTGPNVLATPIAWSEFDVQGKLIDKPEVVRALLEPTMAQFRTSLSTATLPMLAQMTARFGYQLIGHVTQDEPDGTKLILSLAPLPLVRKVDVEVKGQPVFAQVLDDEVKRRMSIRRGSYLPWEPIRRQCAMFDEQHRVEEFLWDQGYFDAVVKIYYVPHSLQYADIRAVVSPKTKYDIDKITVNCPPGSEPRKGRCYDAATDALVELPISDSAIKNIFTHTRHCVIGSGASWYSICWGGGFTRDQYQADVKSTREQLQRSGYPGVRVQASDPRTTINRAKHTVNPVITIDPRRRVEVEFVGYDDSAIQESALRSKLTFDSTGSADDVEAADSARALTTYFQTRGYFDARVTWSRERVDVEPRPGSNELGIHFDRVRFQIDAGHVRRVTSVEFVGNAAISSDTLRGLVATKVANLGGSLFGTTAAATSPELILDQERIKEEYRRAGYPNARVWPSASVGPAGLDNAAMTAALLGVDDTSNLYVRFTIEEGEPTLLTRVV